MIDNIVIVTVSQKEQHSVLCAHSEDIALTQLLGHHRSSSSSSYRSVGRRSAELRVRVRLCRAVRRVARGRALKPKAPVELHRTNGYLRSK
jgi:hypothetical protein